MRDSSTLTALRSFDPVSSSSKTVDVAIEPESDDVEALRDLVGRLAAGDFDVLDCVPCVVWDE